MAGKLLPRSSIEEPYAAPGTLQKPCQPRIGPRIKLRLAWQRPHQFATLSFRQPVRCCPQVAVRALKVCRGSTCWPAAVHSIQETQTPSFAARRWLLVPWEFAKFNVLAGGSAQYGAHPWHWNLTQGLPTVAATLLPLGIAGMVLAER